jgi:hypothetical protein
MGFALAAGVAFTLIPVRGHAGTLTGYSGQEFLLGIFMGDGPVAEQLPEFHAGVATSNREATLAQVDPEKVLAVIDQELTSAKAAGAQEEVDVLEAVKARVQKHGLAPHETSMPFSFEVLIEKINRLDATFFERFAKDIQSGEHLRIRKALREGHDILSKLWHMDGMGMLGDPALASDFFIIQWTTVYVDTAVYSRTAVWEDRFIFGWFSLNSPMEGVLAEEMLVNSIATKFALN